MLNNKLKVSFFVCFLLLSCLVHFCTSHLYIRGSRSGVTPPHPARSIVNRLTENDDADSCAERVNTILQTASWQNVDLKEIRQLEKNLDAHLHERNALQMEGHSAQLEIEPRLYTALTSIGSDCVKTVCEIGFNAGHSALRWLWAAPKAKIIMFDLWQHGSNVPAEEFIRKHSFVTNADERLSIIKGDSTLVVREFHAKNPTTKCNIISVDGGHSYDVALADIKNMRFLADSKFHLLFVDDTNCDQVYCVDSAVQEALKMGIIRQVEGFMEQGNQRGITLFEYV